MMVMPVIIFTDEFESRRAVAEIKPLHHAHFFEQVHGTINRRKVALASWERGENFPVRQRMRMFA